MGGVAVVTDSTADLPPDLAEQRGLRVVPLSVNFGEESFLSRITITEDEFYERLAREEELPTTSRPAPAWFEEAYADCADDGLDAVVSIHIADALSGTLELARLVAADAPLPVEVVDSRQVSGGLGLVALAAQRCADEGGSLEEVVATAERASKRVTTLFVVDTLEFLKKGGRLSGAQALVGSMLRVKPILGISEGRVEVVERTRTRSRALDRLAALAVEQVGDDDPVDMFVAHAVAEDRARALAGQLADRLVVRERIEATIGPVVGTHVGPGALGVAILARDD